MAPLVLPLMLKNPVIRVDVLARKFPLLMSGINANCYRIVLLQLEVFSVLCYFSGLLQKTLTQRISLV